MFTTLQRTGEGLEKHLAVTHLGHFYLLSLLLPKLQKQVARLVTGRAVLLLLLPKLQKQVGGRSVAMSAPAATASGHFYLFSLLLPKLQKQVRPMVGAEQHRLHLLHRQPHP